jgi:hypothetical protein
MSSGSIANLSFQSLEFLFFRPDVRQELIGLCLLEIYTNCLELKVGGQAAERGSALHTCNRAAIGMQEIAKSVFEGAYSMQKHMGLSTS